MGLAPEGYRHRLIEEDLRNQLRAFGAVSIEGPMWCGKTWLGLNASESSFEVGSVDEYGQDNRELVDMNVRLAMEGREPHLIDEWQEVPKLWDAIRSDLDRNPGKGRYILTGSSVLKRKPMHSGTGRIKHLRMRTMSLYESGDSNGDVSLRRIIDGSAEDADTGGTDLEHLVDLTISGGWPGNLGIPYPDRAASVKGYLESVVAKASELDGVRRRESNLWMVMRSLARNESTLSDVSKIHNDTGIPMGDGIPLMLDEMMEAESTPVSYDTVSDYINVFDRLFLIDNQPAFDPNLRSSVRVGKRVKRHLADPSLGITALNVGKDRLMKDLNTYGFFFEAMCERDLDIYARSFGANQYHYRDDSGTEVDSIIELPDGSWAAFEIKLGANKIGEGAESLLAFKEKMRKHGARSVPTSLCVICGLTDHAYMRDDGVYVVPITALRPRKAKDADSNNILLYRNR